MYVQRYIAHFPAAGEVAIFDRSWYNRAGVEPVMGYCTREQSERFIEQVPRVEKAMVDNGIILIKYWLNVSLDEQTRRLESRIEDPRKIWKLSPTDLKSYSRHYDYCGPATRCSRPPTRIGRRGTSWTTTTRSAAGSTSSPTCSARFRTSRSRRRTSRCPSRRAPAGTPSRIARAAHPDAVLGTDERTTR